MNLVEIKQYIWLLSYAEKIQLLQDIADMLKEAVDEASLSCLDKAAKQLGPPGSGPLEAYHAAVQLHKLNQETV
jgi:hypothetical protein